MPTYEETLTYLFNQLPMYQRVGASAYKEGLDGILSLCEHLNNPQKGLRYIHVAGTNGKGSSSHFLSSIFQEAGFSVGLYTSPHLVDFRERIKINGIPVDKEFVVTFTETHKTLFEELKPSFFEMTLAMAFAWFSEHKTDIVILETGMGGRLDSTNIITPELSLITNIGMDHMKFLGDTLEKIAAEKAGIIKNGVPAVISEVSETTLPVFRNISKEKHAPLILAEDLSYCEQKESSNEFCLFPRHQPMITLHSPLTGHYQEANICGVYAAFTELKKKYDQLQPHHFVSGIENVLKNTGLRARWEILQTSPTLICDIGHNAHGFKRILDSITRYPHHTLTMILGFVNDKDLSPVLSQLSATTRYIFTQSSSERSIPANELAQIAAGFGLEGQIEPSVRKAVALALHDAQPDDLIFLGGSTFVVADYLSEKQF